jgi:hypothetical protein
MRSLQIALFLAMVGVAVAYVLRPTGAEFEGFVDAVYDNQGAAVMDTPSVLFSNPTAWATPNDEIDNPLDLPWIASWSPADRRARAGENCAPLYVAAGPEGTTILTTSKSCEAGMAHTRPGDRIYMPDSIPLPLRESTLRHEMFHIYQRRQPDAWAQFYRRQWSFVLHDDPPASMPASVVEARRSNPDTWTPASTKGGTWPCWMGRYWPVPVYKSPQTPTLRDAVTVWWDEWRQEVLVQAPAAWTTFFGDPAQNEHPHEIAAVLLTAEDRSSEAGRRLLDWWNTTGFLAKEGPRSR